MKGVIISISSSCLFGVVYYLAAKLSPLNGLEVVGWRLLFLISILSLFITMDKGWGQVKEILERAKANKILWLVLLCTTCISAVMYWLFVWSPLNGHALNTSLGFFFLPLTLVLAGRIFFGEKLAPLQKLACVCAAVGAVNQLWHVGSVSWTTALATFAFIPYFVLRKHMRIDNLGALWIENLLQTPFAIAFIFLGGKGLSTIAETPTLWYLLPLFGLVSAMALMCYMLASRLLPLGIFGLLGYLEPMLLMFVALLLGESLRPGEQWTFISIWCAMVLLGLDYLRQGIIYRNLLKRQKYKAE